MPEIPPDGTYHGIPWDIDLTPIPPTAPVSSEAPVENAPPSSASITTVEPEVEAEKATDDNRTVIIVVLAVVLLGVVGGSVAWVVRRKRVSNNGQEPTQEK